MIRTGWKVKKLGELVTFQRGHDLPKSEFIRGRYPIAGSNGIIGYHNEFTTKGPSITIGRSGNLGTAYFYEDDFWAHNTTLYIKEFFNTDPKFIFYLLKTLDFAQFNSGSAVPSLNRNYVHPLEVFVPVRLETQRRISAILSALDEKIELNRQTNATLEAIVQTIFKEWFVDFNFPGTTGEMEDTNIGPIPKGWRAGTLTDLIELNPKTSLKKGAIAKYVEMKDLSTGASTINGFIEREFSSGSKFQQGDVLLARITPCLENGKTGFVDFLEKDEVGWGSTEFIVMRGKEAISPYFVYCLARQESFREFAIQSMVGSSGRQRVVDSILSDFPCVIPDEATMAKYHNIAEPLFIKIKECTDQSKVVTQIRDALLPKLMNGEIDIGRAGLEPAPTRSVRHGPDHAMNIHGKHD